MKTIFVVICIILAFLFMYDAAYSGTAIPGRTKSWINDYVGIVDVDTKKYLEDLITSLTQKDRDPIEVIVGTFQSLDGRTMKDFAREYEQNWKRTKRGKEKGVVLIIALKEGRVSIGVGQDIRDILKDEQVNDIINNMMMPEFNKGDFSEGIKRGVEELVKILSKANITEEKPKTINNITLIIALLLVCAVLLKYLFIVKR